MGLGIRYPSRCKRHDHPEIACQGFGRMASAAEWARLLGLPRNTTWRYLKQGFTPEEIAEIRDIKKLKE